MGSAANKGFMVIIEFYGAKFLERRKEPSFTAYPFQEGLGDG
jgi:hypothetical protein